MEAPEHPTHPFEVTEGEFTRKLPQAGLIQRGTTLVEIENLMPDRAPIWLANLPMGTNRNRLKLEPFLSGKRLLTTQTFRNLFRSEIIDSSEEIAVKDITFLFTDLKGSTAMYDQIGDAKAYYLVRQHFDTLGKAVIDQGGAIVKTIGDAVMATFMSPVDAAQAALAMLRGIEMFNQGISH